MLALAATLPRAEDDAGERKDKMGLKSSLLLNLKTRMSWQMLVASHVNVMSHEFVHLGGDPAAPQRVRCITL